jgi:hypothetical protein
MCPRTSMLLIFTKSPAVGSTRPARPHLYDTQRKRARRRVCLCEALGEERVCELEPGGRASACQCCVSCAPPLSDRLRRFNAILIKRSTRISCLYERFTSGQHAGQAASPKCTHAQTRRLPPGGPARGRNCHLNRGALATSAARFGRTQTAINAVPSQSHFRLHLVSPFGPSELITCLSPACSGCALSSGRKEV